MNIRTRFAPSPTGHLHIGGVRTALYNYAFARANGGKFILRIEDTDKERSSKEYELSQINSFHWLGLDWDEGPKLNGENIEETGSHGPYRQSERLEIYTNYAQKLIDKGMAYYCFCSPEELEQMKEESEKNNEAPHYRGKWRDEENFEEAISRVKNGEAATLRFKVDPLLETKFNDNVRGEVVFPANMVGDFVLIRSNGLPVYNFACVVDDIEMEITHVIRGDDHTNNTARQLMLYSAFGAETPNFSHVSMLVGEDRQKLSKRNGVTSVQRYQEMGILPEALNNYLALLGWSHPEEKTIFDQKELVKVFNLDRFNRSPALWDMEKLKWVNGQYLKEAESERLLDIIQSLNSDDSEVVDSLSMFKSLDRDLQVRIVHFLKQHSSTVLEILEKYKNEIACVPNTPTTSEEILEIQKRPETQTIWVYLNSSVRQLASERNEEGEEGDKFLSSSDFADWSNFLKKEEKIKGKALFQGLRYCLTGKAHGMDLKEIITLVPLSGILEQLNQAGLSK